MTNSSGIAHYQDQQVKITGTREELLLLAKGLKSTAKGPDGHGILWEAIPEDPYVKEVSILFTKVAEDPYCVECGELLASESIRYHEDDGWIHESCASKRIRDCCTSLKGS
jgi:hypothetical protein